MPDSQTFPARTIPSLVMNDCPSANLGPAPGRGPISLAAVSFLLGLGGLLLSFFLVGGLLGLAAVGLGWRHLRREAWARKTARWGIGLGVLAILASGLMGAAIYQSAQVAHQFALDRLAEWPAWLGVRAPDLEVRTLDGRTLKLSDLRGQRVVLEFWGPGFAHCVQQIPLLARLAREFPPGQLTILGLTSQSGDKLQACRDKHGVNYPVGQVTNAPPPFNAVRSIPTTFFLDRQGVIQEIALGYRPVTEVRELVTQRTKPGANARYQDYESLKNVAMAQDSAGEPKPAPVPTPVPPPR